MDLQQEWGVRASTVVRDTEDLVLYKATRRVADIIFEHAAPRFGDSHPYRPFLLDSRDQEPNPYHNRTVRSLCLEFFCRAPVALWTPWGEWRFGTYVGDSWELITEELLQKFFAVPHAPSRMVNHVEYGPVYALRNVDQRSFPTPTFDGASRYATSDEARRSWVALTAKYRQINC